MINKKYKIISTIKVVCNFLSSRFYHAILGCVINNLTKTNALHEFKMILSLKFKADQKKAITQLTSLYYHLLEAGRLPLLRLHTVMDFKI